MNTKQSLGEAAERHAKTFEFDEEMSYEETASAEDYSKGAVDMLHAVVDYMTSEKASGLEYSYEEARRYVIENYLYDFKDLIKK